MGGRRLAISLLAALVAALIVAPPAQATFHLIKIREVYPGSVAHPDSGYVELQMYAPGQNLVGGHSVTIRNAAGTTTGTFAFSSSVANAADQQTILVGDSGVQSAFGVAPDLTVSGIGISAAGGAACWGSLDCVSWGGFHGSAPSPTGSPADPLGIPDGMALRRSIAPGCPTLLEAGDDTNDSAADFSDATPSPRNDSSPIVEAECPPPPPVVTIDSHPADPSPGASASFTYHSNESGSSFECSLAAGAAADSFVACPSTGETYTGLADGTYTFKVRATNSADVQGAATAFEWTVDNSLADTTPPQTTILSGPPSPSESSTALFTYESSELGSSFECKLDGTGFASCPAAGIEYSGLANGSHSFEVRATDASGNVDPTPAGYSFDVALPSPPSATMTPAPAPLATLAPAPSTPPASAPRRHRRRRCRGHRRRHGRHPTRRCHRGKRHRRHRTREGRYRGGSR